MRATASYLGLALGDALGATVEFLTASEVRAQYGTHREIIGGGWLHLRAGRVTDDTEMSLALGRALLQHGGLDLPTVAEGYIAWMRGRPIDIGHTCRRGLRRILLGGPLEAPQEEDAAGNGALMRNLPAILASQHDAAQLRQWSLAQAHLTHHHPLADAVLVEFSELTRQALGGARYEQLVAQAHAMVARIPSLRYEPFPGHTSGFIVHTVQTVLEAFTRTDTFEDCVVRAVNRGGDADTAGALAGQLAGAHYGLESLPRRWLRALDPTTRLQIEIQAPALEQLALQAVAHCPLPVIG